MRLKDIQIRHLPLPEKPRKLFDGGGLYLHLTPSGKYWRYRYRFFGKNRTLALGVYPAVSLKEARRTHMEAKLLLAKGIDPSKEKQRRRSELRAAAGDTFEAIALEWYKVNRPQWTSARHAQNILVALRTYVFSRIGHFPVGNISPPMITDLLTAKEIKGKNETAKRVRQYISTVFSYAIRTGRGTYNPALVTAQIGKGRQVVHRPALPQSMIGEFFARLDDYPNKVAQLGLRLLVLTMVRSGELLGAEWAEIEGNEWHIPAEKMKMRRPHVVPLSDWALETLDELRQLRKAESPLLFTGNRNKPVGQNIFTIAMTKMGYRNIAVPHGFRAMASSILNESGLWNPDAIERQLAHQQNNKIRAAYNRAEYMEERHKMMQWYSDFIKSQIKNKT